MLAVFTAAQAGTENNDVSTTKTNREFYQDRERGWYFYEKKPVPEKKKDEKKEKKPVVEEYHKPVIDWAAVMTMPPKKANKLMQDVMDYAITYPTKDNVENYYKLQNIMIKRSENFMATAMLVTQTNPELSDDSYPASRVGQDAFSDQKKQKTDALLQRNADNYALLYFHSPMCGYCQKQTPILQAFADETNWTIKPVDITRDQHAALRFGVQSTPSLVMIKRNSNNWILISSGILSLPELKDRLARSIGQER